ncbi:MAG: GNAT family N-acetyltransferase [Thermoplasmata archaeon]|nr:GNAT family N-acetyltransferase [Thermoplasmata archaeon]
MRASDLAALERWYHGIYLHVARTEPRHYRLRLAPRDVRWFTFGAFRRVRMTRGFVLIAEVGGTPVGFLAAMVEDFPGRYLRLEERPNLQGHIDDIFVEPKVRNRGVGTALFMAAEKRLRAMGCDNLRLGVVAGNEVARRLYRGLGFQETKIGMRKDLARPPADWEAVRARRGRALRRLPATLLTVGAFRRPLGNGAASK